MSSPGADAAQTDDGDAAAHGSSRHSVDFPVVGIGASAGGVTALQRLLEGLPTDSGMAFVVALHLSPTHESHVDALLQRATRMPVQQATQTLPVQANHVYVIPPNQGLAMDGQRLCPHELPPRRGRHVGIDLFMRSLAEAHRERAIGIVLSGRDSDGAVGLATLKEYGGVTIAQSPLDAEHEEMPQHAIATGVVDLVLPASDIGAKLVELWHNARRMELPGASQIGLKAREPGDATGPAASDAAEHAVGKDPHDPEVAEAALQEILGLVKSRTGHDFHDYKRATLLRRLERRMQVTQQPTLPAYRDFVVVHPDETPALLQDLLISVTSFFRDREAFEALERVLVQDAADGTRDPAQMRVWVPGCATGEEAYSVAMLLIEHAELSGHLSGHDIDLQVFASDIDARALTVARAGAYPASITVDVPVVRLRRFFNRENRRYSVKKAVRERILFVAHNVLRDPPFSRLDLVCCRNLLIYLERSSQSRVLEALHFALKPGGLLFLGSSESTELTSHLFTVVDKKHRIYRANPVARGRWRPSAGDALLVPAMGATDAAAALRGEAPLPLGQLHHAALAAHTPASVLVDDEGALVHVSAQAARYLYHNSGVPSNQLLPSVLPPLRLALQTALLQATRTGQRVEARHVLRPGPQGDSVLRMSVRPVARADSRRPLWLVLFDELDSTLDEGDAADQDSHDDSLVRVLQDELLRLGAQLQSSVQEATQTASDLRASNEELQAMNEELRSATEELEMGKESLQSANDELVAVNLQLQSKVDETRKINDDLQNLIAVTDIAAVFVDPGLRIKRYTPRAEEVFRIIASDVGRSLLDITHRLDYTGLADDAALTFSTLRVTEREVRSWDGRTYLLRVLPYRTTEDRIDGAVLSFIDISARRVAEEALRSREERMRLVAQSTRDFAIITLDTNARITSWNQGAEKLFGWREDEILGQAGDVLYTDEDRAHGVPADEVRRAREQGRAEDERWHRRKDGSLFFCSGVMTPLTEGAPHGFAKIARDLTPSKLNERRREAVLSAEKDLRSELQTANAMKDEFLAVLSHELKNPLNLIQINTELLTRLPEVRNLPAVQRATDVIRRTVHSQAKIIDDLLDLSRVHTGKLTLSRTPMDLHAAVERIVEAVRGDAERKPLTLTLHPSDGPFQVYADPVRIEQIVWNLLSNAVKFTPPGGTVDVRLQLESRRVRLDVDDTGLGIEPVMAARVFEMFRQADTRIARETGGLGIGLALVRSLAELHGGEVAVRSPGLGHGSCFSVWLPLSDAVSAPLAADADGTPLQGLRLLVVDDAADALETFGQLLALEGATVTVATSGAEALAHARQQPFDLLLSDVAMPGMDGYELIAALRQLPQQAALRAIAVTGFGRPQDEERALAAGFDAHLGKPVSVQALSDLVARLMRP